MNKSEINDSCSLLPTINTQAGAWLSDKAWHASTESTANSHHSRPPSGHTVLIGHTLAKQSQCAISRLHSIGYLASIIISIATITTITGATALWNCDAH